MGTGIKLMNNMKWTVNLFACILFLLTSTNSFSQVEILEIEGALQIGNSATTIADAGTIRWTGTDFEGYDGNQWVSLITSKIIGDPTTLITDIDGNVYPTIKIGTQLWMRENLRTTRYSDGTPIEEQVLNSDWQSADAQNTGALCWYENNHIIDFIYGKLYNWHAVDQGNLCPAGWRVPSEADLDILISLLGGDNIAGGKMKETGLLHWTSPNSSTSNDSGFTGLPGGLRGNSGGFAWLSDRGYWWTSTVSADNKGRYFYLIYSNNMITKSSAVKSTGLSVRCLKN